MKYAFILCLFLVYPFVFGFDDDDYDEAAEKEFNNKRCIENINRALTQLADVHHIVYKLDKLIDCDTINAGATTNKIQAHLMDQNGKIKKCYVEIFVALGFKPDSTKIKIKCDNEGEINKSVNQLTYRNETETVYFPAVSRNNAPDPYADYVYDPQKNWDYMEKYNDIFENDEIYNGRQNGQKEHNSNYGNYAPPRAYNSRDSYKAYNYRDYYLRA